jgi:hypothetical protein
MAALLEAAAPTSPLPDSPEKNVFVCGKFFVSQCCRLFKKCFSGSIVSKACQLNHASSILPLQACVSVRFVK